MFTFFIAGVLVLPAIIYFTVRAAVYEGTLNALKEFDKYRAEKIENSSDKQL